MIRFIPTIDGRKLVNVDHIAMVETTRNTDADCHIAMAVTVDRVPLGKIATGATPAQALSNALDVIERSS